MNKILFILHSNNLLYGAAKSIKPVLENINLEYDIIVTRTMYKKYGIEKIRHAFNNKPINIFVFDLPLDENIIIDNSITNIKVLLKRTLYNYYVNTKYYLNKHKLNQIIKSHEYSIIYLNSVVLYKLISKNNKYIVHVRELIQKQNKKRVIKKLELASSVIYIDLATKNRIGNESNIHSYVVNNPFDMGNIKRIKNDDKIYNKYGINRKKIIISMIGVINEQKGSDLVINISKYLLSQYQILIVGNGDRELVKYLKTAENTNKSLKYLGEIENIEEIYFVSDYIIRAEKEFCIGRTIYEGLFSGCDVIIPGEENKNADMIYDYSIFKDMIHFYEPRNTERLLMLINSLKKVDKSNRICMSNKEDYTKKIESIIMSCL